MKARSIARELALLGISQLNDAPAGGRTSRQLSHQAGEVQLPSPQQLDALMMKALRALGADVKEAIESAEANLQRSGQLILESETRVSGTDAQRERIQPTVELIQSAINQVGASLDLLIFTQQAESKPMVTVRRSLESAAQQLEKGDRTLQDNAQRAAGINTARQQLQRAIAAVQSAILTLKQSLKPAKLANLIERSDIRGYAFDLLDNWVNYWQAVDAQLDDAMEKWNVRRLARVDRDILRLAMIEIIHMGVPKGVAIDEAIEIAKRYSDEEGYRFINGVLRRATDKLEAAQVE